MPSAQDAVSDSMTAPAAATAKRSIARECFLLSKPGITRLVTIASGVGFAVSTAWAGRPMGSMVAEIIGCLIGTAVASAGANALNQVLEVDRDALMDRTAGRPLPAGRLSRSTAVTFAWACSLIGPLLIGLTSNWIAGAVAAATILLYVAVYTPLKPVSPISTYVGAIPGALPCLIGWCAASPTPGRDLLSLPAWSVFAILMVWQIPHFFAIALMYRDQYRKAGFKPLPEGVSSARVANWVLAWTALTVAVSGLPLLAMPSLVGGLYTLVAAVMAAVFVYSAAVLAQQPTVAKARSVFLTSIAYLPVVYLALVADAVIWNPLEL